MPDSIAEPCSKEGSESKKDQELVKDSSKISYYMYDRQKRKEEMRRLCREMMGCSR